MKKTTYNHEIKEIHDLWRSGNQLAILSCLAYLDGSTFIKGATCQIKKAMFDLHLYLTKMRQLINVERLRLWIDIHKVLFMTPIVIHLLIYTKIVFHLT